MKKHPPILLVYTFTIIVLFARSNHGQRGRAAPSTRTQQEKGGGRGSPAGGEESARGPGKGLPLARCSGWERALSPHCCRWAAPLGASAQHTSSPLGTFCLPSRERTLAATSRMTTRNEILHLCRDREESRGGGGTLGCRGPLPVLALPAGPPGAGGGRSRGAGGSWWKRKGG